MMAALFAIMALSIGALLYGKRSLTIALWLIGMLLSALMFMHHATDALKIMW